MKFSSTLAEQFRAPLKEFGYRKKNNNWTKSDSEITLLINIQQSRWGNWAYVNCGIFVQSIQSVPSPKEYDCQIRFRLERVVPGEAGKLIHGEFHDFPSASPREPNDTDAAVFAKALVEFGLPFLERFSDIAKLRELIAASAGSEDRAAQFTRQLSEEQIKLVQAKQ